MSARRVHLAEVEDELRQILDRVDVVVRRRRDERDARLRAAQARDLLGHLVRGDLAALAGLRALRDLDLQLVGERGVLGRHAEPARRDLLDRGVALGAEARGVLPALARVRPRAEAVERDRDRLVRLRGQRAVRHRAAGEPAHDRLRRLDLLERHGWAGRYELEEVARLQRRTLVDERREAVVEVGAAVAHRRAQRVGARRPRPAAHPRRPESVACGSPPLRNLTYPGFSSAGSRRARRFQARERLPLEALEPSAADRRRRPGEELGADVLVEADRLEQARAAIARDVRDAHLGHHLEHALLEPGEQPPLRLVG